MKTPVNRNDKLTLVRVLGCVSCTLALGCAAEQSPAKQPSYAEVRQDDLASERREFISDTQKRLAHINNDMDLLRRKLGYDLQYVNSEQRTEWSQELFELGKEYDSLRGELDRAQTASATEWEQMRGPLSAAADLLQARVNNIGLAFAGRIDAAPNQSHVWSSHTGLCPVNVGKVEADVQRAERTLVVTVTTARASSVATLQARAQSMTRVETYPTERQRSTDRSEPPFSAEAQVVEDAPPGVAFNGSAQAVVFIPVKVTVENVNDGAKLVFAPVDGQLEELEARLENDSQRLEGGLCPVTEEVSLNQTLNK